MTASALPEMPCAELVERVTDYLEGALPEHDAHRLEVHLGECEHCVDYVDQLRRTRTLTGELRTADLSPPMRDELLAAFARWRDELQRPDELAD